MKQSKTCLFAFRPEHYRQMEDYLQKMLAEGWKLRWCKGILAGFEPADDPTLRYAVDPYAVTSISYFRRYPRARLQEQMQAGWYSVGKSKGCQILCTTEANAPRPEMGEDAAAEIQNTCRTASMAIAILILLAGWKLLSSPTFVYNLLLTNLYLMLGVAASFLLVYHLFNAALLMQGTARARGDARRCRRYQIHDGGLLLLLLAAIVVELGGRNDMMLYLCLPILVMAVSIFLLKKLSRKGRPSNQMFLLVAAAGVVLFFLIVAGNSRMSQSNTQWSAAKKEQLLEQVDSLPVLRLADFGGSESPQSAVRENRSLLGRNLLYAEEDGEDYVFTNHTRMKSPFLAEQIFRYLHQQAQTDFQETFRMETENGVTWYVLDQANTCLAQLGDTVYYITVPKGQSPEAGMERLVERSEGLLS